MANITIDEHGVPVRPRSCGFSWLSHLRVAGYSGPLVSSNLEGLTGKSWENHWKMWEHHGKMWANMGKTMKPHYKWSVFLAWRNIEKHGWWFFSFPFPRLITDGELPDMSMGLQAMWVTLVFLILTIPTNSHYSLIYHGGCNKNHTKVWWTFFGCEDLGRNSPALASTPSAPIPRISKIRRLSPVEIC